MSVRKYLSAVVAAAAILSVPGVASAQENTKITIGLASGSLPAGMARYANEMGLFKKHGLDASVVPMDSASVATAALISGSIQFTVGSTNEVVVAKTRGQDLIGVESLNSGGLTGVVILAKDVAEKLNVAANAPVEQKLKALDGLVIATPDAKSSLTFVLKPATEKNDAKVRFTYIAQTAMPAALESGAVQGFMASSPMYAQPIKSGKGVEWISGPKNEFPKEFLPGNPTALSTTQAYAKENPDVIQKVRAALSEFSQAVKERPAEVKATILKIYPTLEPALLDVIYSNEGSAFQAKPVTVESMQREIDFVKLNNPSLPGLDQLDPASMTYNNGN
jgi:ABC-type nitrate/sulfonate/bicarbonate transport system substrate-binding protein